MNWINNNFVVSDLILAVIIGYGAFRGYKKGFLVELFSLVFLIIGLFLVLYLSSGLLSLGDFKETTNASFYIIGYIILGILVSIISRKIQSWISYSVFDDFDSIIGMALGVAKHILFLAFFMSIMDAIGIDSKEAVSNQSKLLPILLEVKETAVQVISDALPFVAELDQQVQQMLKK